MFIVPTNQTYLDTSGDCVGLNQNTVAFFQSLKDSYYAEHIH